MVYVTVEAFCALHAQESPIPCHRLKKIGTLDPPILSVTNYIRTNALAKTELNLQGNLNLQDTLLDKVQ